MSGEQNLPPDCYMVIKIRPRDHAYAMYANYTEGDRVEEFYFGETSTLEGSDNIPFLYNCELPDEYLMGDSTQITVCKKGNDDEAEFIPIDISYFNAGFKADLITTANIIKNKCKTSHSEYDCYAEYIQDDDPLDEFIIVDVIPFTIEVNSEHGLADRLTDMIDSRIERHAVAFGEELESQMILIEEDEFAERNVRKLNTNEKLFLSNEMFLVKKIFNLIDEDFYISNDSKPLGTAADINVYTIYNKDFTDSGYIPEEAVQRMNNSLTYKLGEDISENINNIKNNILNILDEYDFDDDIIDIELSDSDTLTANIKYLGSDKEYILNNLLKEEYSNNININFIKLNTK